MDNQLQRRFQELLSRPQVSPHTDQRIGGMRLQEPLGEGGYGWVWKAYNSRLKKVVAIKLFKFSGFPDPIALAEAGRRFHDGALAMSKLGTCPHVVKLVEGPTICDGYLWFSMEWIPTRDLGGWIDGGTLTVSDKKAIVDQLLQAIKYAHCDIRYPVVHRDVKPGNILVTRNAFGDIQVFLSDFDTVFHEHLVEGRNTTRAGFDFGRYFPMAEILAEDSTKRKALLRRPGNDLYGAALVIFELYGGRVGKQVPLNGGEREFFKVLPGPNIIGGLETTQRRRVAILCSKGLANYECERFRDVNDMIRCWEAPRVSKFTERTHFIALSISAILALFFAADAGFHRFPAGGLAQSLISSVAGSVTILWATTRLGSQFNDITGVVERFFSQFPRIRWCVPALLAVIAVWTASATKFATRIGEGKTSVIAGGDCFAVSPSGERKLSVGDIVTNKEREHVECEQGVKFEILAQSWWGWVPAFSANREPRKIKERPERPEIISSGDTTGTTSTENRRKTTLPAPSSTSKPTKLKPAISSTTVRVAEPDSDFCITFHQISPGMHQEYKHGTLSQSECVTRCQNPQWCTFVTWGHTKLVDYR